MATPPLGDEVPLYDVVKVVMRVTMIVTVLRACDPGMPEATQTEGVSLTVAIVEMDMFLVPSWFKNSLVSIISISSYPCRKKRSISGKYPEAEHVMLTLSGVVILQVCSVALGSVTGHS